MDRFIIKQPRITDCPQSNQINDFGGGNTGIPYSPFGTELQGVHLMTHPGYRVVTELEAPVFTSNLQPGQGQVMSGIDPRYLAAYTDPNATFIATGQQIQRERCTMPVNSPFGNDYQKPNVPPPERNLNKTFSPTNVIKEVPSTNLNNYNTYKLIPPPLNSNNYYHTPQRKEQTKTVPPAMPSSPTNAPAKKLENPEMYKSESQNVIISRSDKLKALHRSGMRVFSGPVEKVLKWHKVLQDIGVFVLYEVVAKCVSVRQAEACAKNLVVRDENGPAMQIVYYEVDFLLPDLQPPCTVRVIGRMMAGTCRFQAFNVRSATGDDVATLPRRAAVAAHHVAKLHKEYGLSA